MADTWADRLAGLKQLKKPARAESKRVLVNLVGPPGAGKSTLAAAFVRRNPEWTLLTIDKYMLSGLEHRDAWEAIRTHARCYPRVILESSGLSRYLRPLLVQSAHATVRVTSEEAKRRRDTRPKERVKAAEKWGTQDDLATACDERLPTMYPQAFHMLADGPWEDVLDTFTALMAKAEERARAGGDTAPEPIRWPQKNRKPPDPVKRRARKAVERAIRKGEMERLPCQVCGAAPAEAHHENYADPLRVIFLCPTHHAEAHRRQRQARAARSRSVRRSG